MGFSDILFLPSEGKNVEKFFEQNVDLLHFKEGFSIFKVLDFVNEGKFRNLSVHEFLSECEMQFISPSEPLRNPELEKRVQKLKAEQQNAEYRAMTQSLFPDSTSRMSIRKEVHSVSSQMTAVINFVLTVGGSFFFAYKATEYALPSPNVAGQVMMGLVTSIVVAVADLYFLLRTI